MKKVAIVTDSIACLATDLIERYGIGIIPLNFFAGGKLYKDGIDVTPSQAYELFLQDPDDFKTSAASPGDCLEAYRQAGRQANDILCVTLSSRLSAVYDVARNATSQAGDELSGHIHVLDSQTAAAAEGFIALAAARAAEKGNDLSGVISVAAEVRDKVRLVAFMDTVRHIYRSGRIPKLASVAGSMLNIRPVFTFSAGVPRFMGAVRNRQRGQEVLLGTMKKQVGLSPVHVAVMHVYSRDRAELLKTRISSEFNCIELLVTEFSPLMAYACGTGTLGVAFYPGEQA